jgi:hypothetical protein
MYSTVAYSARISCFQSQQDGFEAPIFFKTVGTKVRGQFTPGEDKRYPTERPKYKKECDRPNDGTASNSVPSLGSFRMVTKRAGDCL